MIKMINNKVLITPDSIEETTESGIILSKAEAEIPDKGIVVSAGNKVKELKEGDYVIYQPRHAMRIKHENIEYLMFPESSIIAKINK
jgi:chaperonin GroES